MTRPLGAFLGTSTAPGSISRLVLINNHDLSPSYKFHRESEVQCFTTPCNPVSDGGSYSYTKSGTTSYIRLKHDGVSDKIAYTYANGVLKLRVAGSSTWQKLTASVDYWCESKADCGSVQAMPSPKCPGAWTCDGENMCLFECGPAPVTQCVFGTGGMIKECDACVLSKCAVECGACSTDADCLAIIGCVQTGSTIDNCLAKNPKGAAAYTGMIGATGCWESKCKDVCGPSTH